MTPGEYAAALAGAQPVSYHRDMMCAAEKSLGQDPCDCGALAAHLLLRTTGTREESLGQFEAARRGARVTCSVCVAFAARPDFAAQARAGRACVDPVSYETIALFLVKHGHPTTQSSVKRHFAKHER